MLYCNIFNTDLSSMSSEEINERCSHCLEKTDGEECAWLENKNEQNNNDMTTIFIPSKNRVKNCKTILLAAETGAEITIVLEPQDKIDYHSKFMLNDNIKYLQLPENNQGITYVRNFIKKYTEDNNIYQYWQLDDDISALSYREGTKLIKSDFLVLEKAEKDFKDNSVALGALEYGQFAWCATKQMVYNSFCDVAVFVDNTKTFGSRYRSYVEGKEDRDFAMQVIKSGCKTARHTVYAFNAPKNGSNAGGLKEIFYDAGKEEQCANRMVETWGEDICQRIVKQDGRPDVKIHWDRINSKQPSLF